MATKISKLTAGLLQQMGKFLVATNFAIHVLHASHQGFTKDAQHVDAWKPYLNALQKGLQNLTSVDLPLHRSDVRVTIVIALALIQTIGMCFFILPYRPASRLGALLLFLYTMFEAFVGYNFRIHPVDSVQNQLDTIFFFKDLAVAGALLTVASQPA